MSLKALLAVLAIPLLAPGPQVQSVAIEFPSGGSRVTGRFFPAAARDPVATLLLVPGWPGNTEDVLGLGALLAAQDVSVLIFNPRGLHHSEGTASFAGTLEDIAAALDWLRRRETQERLLVEPAEITLGGYSYGGGMAMAYAAADTSVRRVISIAGNDHGEFIRRMQREPEFARAMRQMLMGTRAPDGPARFDLEATLRELEEHQDVYGLRENAARLAQRAILLIGGWEDTGVTVETVLLPLYRALKREGGSDVTFLVYHADHGLGSVRGQLASDVRDWLLQHRPR